MGTESWRTPTSVGRYARRSRVSLPSSRALDPDDTSAQRAFLGIRTPLSAACHAYDAMITAFFIRSSG
jgi:hypothetical protein